MAPSGNISKYSRKPLRAPNPTNSRIAIYLRMRCLKNSLWPNRVSVFPASFGCRANPSFRIPVKKTKVRRPTKSRKLNNESPDVNAKRHRYLKYKKLYMRFASHLDRSLQYDFCIIQRANPFLKLPILIPARFLSDSTLFSAIPMIAINSFPRKHAICIHFPKTDLNDKLNFRSESLSKADMCISLNSAKNSFVFYDVDSFYRIKSLKFGLSSVEMCNVGFGRRTRCAGVKSSYCRLCGLK